MKKALMAVFVLAALAVTPALAQASVTLKSSSSGKELAQGATVTLASHTLMLKNGSGSFTIECYEAEYKGTVNQNPKPEVDITKNPYSACTGYEMDEQLLFTLPTTMYFEGGGAGQVRIPNATMTITFRIKGGLVGECTYNADLSAQYEFDTNLVLDLETATMTKLSGNSFCENTLYLNGSLGVYLEGETPVEATSSGSEEPTFGLFRNSGGTQTPVFTGEALQGSSNSPTIKMSNGALVECTNDTLAGVATQPAAQPALAEITSTSFTGEAEPEGPGHRCKYAAGFPTDVTTNASSGWTLSFNDETGQSAKGSLQGPIVLTVVPYFFGPITTCVYEIESIGTSFSFEQALGLKFNTVTMPRISGGSMCGTSAEVNLGKLTITQQNAGNLPVEVIAG